jgi:hypothetical protein
MKFYVKIALFAVLVVAISGILYGLFLFNKRHPDTAKARPDFIITSTVLQKEFEENEKTASGKYVNKILEVTGNIVSITPSDSANTNVSLKTGSDMSSVICAFHSTDGTLKLKTGEEITLRGECSGFLMDVLLKNCSVITKRK